MDIGRDGGGKKNIRTAVRLAMTATKDFDCKTCEQKEQRNCDGKTNPKFRFTAMWGKYAALQLNRCPIAWMAFVGVEASQWIDDFRWLKRGFLPYDGGYLQQPAKWVAAITQVELEQGIANQIWAKNFPS